YKRMRRAVWARFRAGGFAPKVVFINRSQTGVRISGADHAELVGIHSQFLLQLQSVSQSGTCILELQHLRLFFHGEIEIALVPPLVIRKLIVGRKKRMRFAVALYLSNLVDPFALSAGFGIFAVDRFSRERFDNRKHGAVAQISIVSNGQHLATSLLLVPSHPLPQVPWVVAAKGFLRGVRLDHTCLARIVTEENVAVEVVPSGVRGPFVTDECCEAAGFVCLLRGLDNLLPCSLEGRCAGQGEKRFRDSSFAEVRDEINGCHRPLPVLNHVVPALTLWVS